MAALAVVLMAATIAKAPAQSRAITVSNDLKHVIRLEVIYTDSSRNRTWELRSGATRNVDFKAGANNAFVKMFNVTADVGRGSRMRCHSSGPIEAGGHYVVVEAVYNCAIEQH